MKAERIDALLEEPVWDESLMARLPSAIFEMLLRYMMNADVDAAALERTAGLTQAPELKQTAVTLAQKLRQEGRQEGRLQTLRDSVVEALGIRFGEVPPGLREEIQTLADEDKLHGLLRTAIQCPGLESFAEEL